jgi:hypothetical protein
MHRAAQKSRADAPQRGEMKASNNVAELQEYNDKFESHFENQFLF